MVNHACQDADVTDDCIRFVAQLQGGVSPDSFESHHNTPAAAHLDLMVSVDIGRLDRIKNISEQVTRLRLKILRWLGKSLTLVTSGAFGSPQRSGNSRGYMGGEDDGVSLRTPCHIRPSRHIVEVRNFEVGPCDLNPSPPRRIGKNFPLFNQIKSRTGVVRAGKHSILRGRRTESALIAGYAICLLMQRHRCTYWRGIKDPVLIKK
jgi:hypothetical protein